MPSKWCVIVFVLWTTAYAIGSDPKSQNTQSSGRSDSSSDQGRSSALTSPSDPKNVILVNHRIKRETDGLTLKVRLANGSYVFRKMTVINPVGSSEEDSGPVTRVARGYKKGKGSKGATRAYGTGYGRKEKKFKGYVLPTPPKPIGESVEENDSQFLDPPEAAPPPVSPDRSALFTTTTPPPADDPWDIRDSVPGEPGRDYNVFGGIPTTNFSCEAKTPGFYADVEAGCQVFHRCTDDPWYTGQVRVTMDSFLCPNGSLFNQQIYTCDWWGNVDCNTSPEFYQLNEQIGQLEETNAGTIQYVQFGGVRVPPPPGQKRKAPAIVPKSKRQPLPDKYRSKHTEGDYSGKSKPVSEATDANKNGNAGGLSVSEDEDRLLEQFDEENEAQFRRFSPDNSDSTNNDDSEDRDGTNIDEVTEPAPTTKKPPKKSSKKSSKKGKTTTTTTTPEPEDDEESEESEEDEEEPASTNNEAQGLIVNRGETDGKPPSGLEPPTSDFQGDPVDSDGARKDDSDADGTYIPPTTAVAPTYIPPTPGGYSYAKPQNAYLPPKDNSKQNDAYLPPKDNGYLPPKQNDAYLPPKDTGYLPPKQNDAYLPPKDNEYLPPKVNNAYLPPRQDQQGYISGASPPTYLPPTAQTYGPPNNYQQSPDSYYRKPSMGYGTPIAYGAPTPPTQAYGQPHPLQTPIREYGPHSQEPKREYLPVQQPQNGGYGTPPQPGFEERVIQLLKELARSQYGPSQSNQQNSGYNAPQPSQPNREYLPAPAPQKPSTQYLPQSNQGYSSSPPQQPNREYLPAPKNPSTQYLPQSNQQGYASSPPQQPNREYLPAPKNPSTQYLPQSNQGYSSSPPQQPNREYLPAPKPEYSASPPKGYSSNPSSPPRQEYFLSPPRNDYPPPSREYLPRQQQNNREYGAPETQGYTLGRYPTTTEHWPAKYDYESPTSPSSVQRYNAPTQSPPVITVYSTQKQDQGSYSPGNQGLAPPVKEFGQSNQHGQSSYPSEHAYFSGLRDAVPTTITQYSTIPVQTPPPREEESGKRPYTVHPAVNIQFYPVPLVSYSHQVDATSSQSDSR